MTGNAHHGGSPDDARSRRKVSAVPRRIGWRAANRIVSGKDGGPGAEDLRALIAVASMQKSSHERADAEPAGRDAMLALYRESAAGPETGTRRRRAGSGRGAEKGAGGRQTPRALVLRFAAAVLLVCGVGAAAASAGVLPAGVQRIARDYFGIGGVSAPARHVPSASALATGPPRSSGSRSNGNNAAAPSSASSSNAAPASTDVVMALCQKVSQNESDWESAVDATGQATLITAAGGEHKVKSYCARLLAGNGKNGNGNGLTPAATPKASAAGSEPSPAPSAEPTGPHGKSHASRSPAAHGGG